MAIHSAASEKARAVPDGEVRNLPDENLKKMMHSRNLPFNVWMAVRRNQQVLVPHGVIPLRYIRMIFHNRKNELGFALQPVM